MSETPETGRHTSTADEPSYACMYCKEVRLGRGMEGHVRLTDDAQHAPRGELPDGYALSACEPVSSEPVTVSRPIETNDHSRFLCTHCTRICMGKRGLGVHIARTDDAVHPDTTDQPVDYAAHVHFPADTDRRTIVVPADVHPALISLTETERAEGWDVTADPAFELGETVLIPEKETALEILGEACMDYLNRNEDIGPVEAYRLFDDVLGRLPEVRHDA